MPSQSCNWAKILIGGVSHKSKQKGTKKGIFLPINIVSRIQWTTSGNIHLSLFGSFLQKTCIAKNSHQYELTHKIEKTKLRSRNKVNDCESEVCQQDGCKIISWTMRPLSPKTLDYPFWLQDKPWICRFFSYNCTRSNVDPRTVNRLVAKLFPGPGDLFHSDKAILSRHQTWLSEKQVTSINILKSDL